MYRVRIPIGIGLFALLFFVLWADLRAGNAVPFACLVGVVAMAGLYEFYRLAGARGSWSGAPLGVAAGGLLVLAQWAELRWPQAGGLVGPAILALMALALVGTMLAGDHPPPAGGRPGDHAVVSLAFLAAGLVYVWWPLSFFLLLRAELPGRLGLADPARAGLLLVAYVVVVAKGADMGGYLVGKALGRTKLIPRISPKKSLEGALGGLVLSVLLAVLLDRWMPVGRRLGDLPAAAFGLVMAPLSLAGDLAESYLKRWAGAKDSGALIPEYGGVLDLVDSLTFCGPAGYYVLLWAHRYSHG